MPDGESGWGGGPNEQIAPTLRATKVGPSTKRASDQTFAGCESAGFSPPPFLRRLRGTYYALVSTELLSCSHAKLLYEIRKFSMRVRMFAKQQGSSPRFISQMFFQKCEGPILVPSSSARCTLFLPLRTLPPAAHPTSRCALFRPLRTIPL